MIYVYWPYKKVPAWFMTVKLYGPGAKDVKIHHRGFGVILNWKRVFHVFPFSKGCVYIGKKKNGVLFDAEITLHCPEGVIFHTDEPLI